MLNTTSSLVYVLVVVHSIVVLFSTNVTLCVCVIQRVYVCVDFMYSLFVLAYIYIIMISLCVCLLVSEEESFLTILLPFYA